MSLLERFLDPSSVSLKICGVTTRDDANRLVTMGVDALGVNFWPQSKRYLAPEEATWLRDLAGKILRVGVFVNEPPELPLRLIREGYLDVVQLHGDETPEDAAVISRCGDALHQGHRREDPGGLGTCDGIRSRRDPARCARAGYLRRHGRGVRLGGRVRFPQGTSATACHIWQAGSSRKTPDSPR